MKNVHGMLWHADMQSVLQAVAQSQNFVLQLTTCQGDRGGGRGGADKASQPSEECFARQQDLLWHRTASWSLDSLSARQSKMFILKPSLHFIRFRLHFWHSSFSFFKVPKIASLFHFPLLPTCFLSTSLSWTRIIFSSISTSGQCGHPAYHTKNHFIKKICSFNISGLIAKDNLDPLPSRGNWWTLIMQMIVKINIIITFINFIITITITTITIIIIVICIISILAIIRMHLNHMQILYTDIGMHQEFFPLVIPFLQRLGSQSKLFKAKAK